MSETEADVVAMERTGLVAGEKIWWPRNRFGA